MDHFLHPRNVGEIKDADGIGNVGNPVCGDIMKLYIKVEDGKITDVKFKTFGCGAAISTSSMVTEMVKGKTIAEALSVTNRAVAEALGGLPAVKMHCSVLAEEALRSALKDYYQKQGKKVPFFDFQVNFLQGLGAVGVGLRQIFYFNGFHIWNIRANYTRRRGEILIILLLFAAVIVGLKLFADTGRISVPDHGFQDLSKVTTV